MEWGQRKSQRVAFERGYAAQLMAIDGTWRRDCTVLDISALGARLRLGESIDGLNLKEFFLVLAKTGLVHRRCELVRIKGDEIGISFINQPKSLPRRGHPRDAR